MKEMTGAAEVMMTEEEKEALEKERVEAFGGATPKSPEPMKIDSGHSPERQGSPTGKHLDTDKKGRPKLTPEQKAKLKDLEEERRKNLEKRYVFALAITTYDYMPIPTLISKGGGFGGEAQSSDSAIRSSKEPRRKIRSRNTGIRD